MIEGKIQDIGFALIAACRETNADRLSIKIENVTHKKEAIGTWEIVVQKVVPEWIIWSNEHRAYWGKNRSGYVSSRKDAGRYTFDEALEIVEGANKYRDNDDEPFEAMIYANDERGN